MRKIILSIVLACTLCAILLVGMNTFTEHSLPPVTAAANARFEVQVERHNSSYSDIQIVTVRDKETRKTYAYIAWNGHMTPLTEIGSCTIK